MIYKFIARCRRLFQHPKVWEMKRRAARSMKNLQLIQNHTSRIKPGDRLLMTMGRDENRRIPYFLEYYRKLGIDHFLFVDNSSLQPMAEVLSGEPDVSLWRTEESYADTRYGVDWMNALLSKYAVGHWTLTVDLDEFFVYPFMETRSFDDLISFLEDIEKPSMFSMLVDMYPKDSICSTHVPVGESPLDHAPYFDRTGYYQVDGGYEDTYVRGGPRLRVFNANDINAAPALNKIPLIKWRARYVYYLSTHVAYPTFLNHAHRGFHEPTGALLHFKFISSFREKIDQAISLQNHYNSSHEYQKYLDHLKESENFTLYGPVSTRYVDSHSLIETNLMTPGCWK
jgi:Glycosyl transferase family 2